MNSNNNVDQAAYNRMNELAGGSLLPAPLLPLHEPGPDDKDRSWNSNQSVAIGFIFHFPMAPKITD